MPISLLSTGMNHSVHSSVHSFPLFGPGSVLVSQWWPGPGPIKTSLVKLPLFNRAIRSSFRQFDENYPRFFVVIKTFFLHSSGRTLHYELLKQGLVYLLVQSIPWSFFFLEIRIFEISELNRTWHLLFLALKYFKFLTLVWQTMREAVTDRVREFFDVTSGHF